MKLKKVILIGTTGSSFYGFRADLIKNLVSDGHQVYAFTSEYTDACLDKIKVLGAIPICYELSRGGLNPLADIASTMELVKKIKSIQPDIVFSYFTKPVVYGSLAAKISQVPRVVGMIEGLGSPFTVHRHGQSSKMRMIRFVQVSLYRLVFPFLDKIIFLNPDDPMDLIEKNKISVKKDAVKVLGPIGLNLSDYQFKEWDNTKTISFIFIARLIAEKGIFEFIEAAKKVKHKYPLAIFKVIGGLDHENPHGLTQKELDEMINSGIIEYPGFVTNVAERIQDSAVFVLPSYYREGVPRSTQEAMAIGRPVITTDVPGCRETVVDGVNGFLVPKWDAEALATKMCYFIEHPEQINVMGLESFKIAQEKFDAEKINLKLIEIIGLSSKNETTY